MVTPLFLFVHLYLRAICKECHCYDWIQNTYVMMRLDHLQKYRHHHMFNSEHNGRACATVKKISITIIIIIVIVIIITKTIFTLSTYNFCSPI